MSAIDLANLAPDLTTRRQRLEERLSAFSRQVRTRVFAAGAARIVAQIALLALASFLLDHWLRLSLSMRLCALTVAIAILAWQIWKHLITPLQFASDPVALAAALDRADREISNPIAPRVATVLRLPQLLNHPRPPSKAMVRRAVEHADDSLRNVNFANRLDDTRFKLNLGAISAIGLIAVVLIATNSGLAALWARRWFAGSNQPWPQRTYLDVVGLSDGRILVPRGEPYVLRATVQRGAIAPQMVSLKLRDARGGSKVNTAMTRFGTDDFRYDLPAVESTMQCEIEGGDEYLGPFLIEPIDRPRIAELKLTSQHPRESAPQVHSFTGQDADLSFLPQTKLKLEFASNVPITKANVKSPVPPKRIDDRRFEIEWTHSKPEQIEIELIGAQSNLASLPTPVTIGLKVDQPPRVSLSYSGVRQRIAPTARIPITILARDDYGIASVDVASKVDSLDADKRLQATATTRPIVPTTKPSETEVQVKEEFDVTSVKAAPGALLSLSARASDACYQGPQTGASRPASFRVVESQELFREILLRQQGERAKFRKALEASKKIREALAALASIESASPIARDYRTVHREVQRITTSLAESLTELKCNRLGNQEMYDLMDRTVLKPLSELSNDLMTPQRDVLDALSADRAGQTGALARQDQIVAKMEDILKQMAQWDSFVDVLNQLNEIIRMQEKVKAGTDELKGKQSDSVFDK